MDDKEIPKWNAPAPTKHELPWADILTVDLSLYETHRNELVQTVATALERDGFFYVVGHGIEAKTVRLGLSTCGVSGMLIDPPVEPTVRPGAAFFRWCLYGGKSKAPRSDC